MHPSRTIGDLLTPRIASAAGGASAPPGVANWLRALLGAPLSALEGRRQRRRGARARLQGMNDALLRDIGQAPAPRSSRSNLDRDISLFQL
ncbi:MAG: DUF1127 domain-containing protein [Acetobacteraceae bacterium]|nr:DUF1127 domain-containing protein [Acetobacteraceae bacterium]